MTLLEERIHWRSSRGKIQGTIRLTVLNCLTRSSWILILDGFMGRGREVEFGGKKNE